MTRRSPRSTAAATLVIALLLVSLVVIGSDATSSASARCDVTPSWIDADDGDNPSSSSAADAVTPASGTVSALFAIAFARRGPARSAASARPSRPPSRAPPSQLRA
jgi:hypothetical protein